MADGPPPPPPPPHGQVPRPPGGLPDGNYDVFIIPPHSAGGGFLYLPSLQPQRNSFLAGIAVALAAVGIGAVVVPVLSAWFQGVMAGPGVGFLLLIACVGVGAWAIGKTSAENSGSENGTGGGSASGKSRSQYGSARPPPNAYAQHPSPGDEQAPPPPPPRTGSYAPPPPKPAPAQSGWEKAREETKKKAEEARRAEDLRKKREAAQKMRDEQQRAKEEAEAAAQKAREEAEKEAKAAAEKIKWEQMRARQKEQLERAARERLAKEKADKDREAREKDTREREAREKADKAKADREAAVKARLEKMRAERVASTSMSDLGGNASPPKPYVRPTAKSYVGTEEYSARPYDTPSGKSRPMTFKSSASSISGLSESSYAPSMSTARTTPPPSYRGPYSNNDPGKIQIKAVYLFSDSFPGKPIQQLVAGERPITDGLILKIETAGLFIDDDVRGVAQREWDVKAWTLKSVEDGGLKGGGKFHVFRAFVKDGENKRYVFVMEPKEAQKIKLGLDKLKQGSQLKKLDSSSMKESEVKGVLGNLGWI